MRKDSISTVVSLGEFRYVGLTSLRGDGLLSW